MKLTFEQIKACTVGALRISQEADGIHFARMSEHAEKAFAAADSTFYDRARSTTECRLEFHTDSRNLRLDVNTICIESNVNGKYEIFIDDNSALFVKGPGPQTYSLALPEGDKHITIALPCHNIGIIRNVFLDEGSYVRPHTFERKMLFLGDSITQGYNATHDAMSYSYTVARHFNAASLNQAVGGAKFDSNTLEAIDFDPDFVFVAYGTNDYGHFPSADSLRHACAGYLDKVKALWGSKQVFCITPIWRRDGCVVRAAGSHEDCRKIIMEEIARCGFTHIDGYKMFPHMTEFFADGYLHPNDYGFSIYARNLIRVLESYI